jgi:hypothetical protein
MTGSKGLDEGVSFEIVLSVSRSYVCAVQRLFSMFPAGAAGYGLLILRLCAAAMLMHQTMNGGSSVCTIWALVCASVVALLLCLGVLTPFSCVASGIVQISTWLHHTDCLPSLIFSLAVTLALFLLGPGAVSIDAHLFGRRLIVRSN